MTRYDIRSVEQIPSPSLLLFIDIACQNIQTMCEIAGDPQRLRPHCKTHKVPQLIKIQIEQGITRHKCATFAEAEMLAHAGCKDIFLAYNLVGPNIDRAVRYRLAYPAVKLIATADHRDPILELSAAMNKAGTTIELAIDIDSGYMRTGISDPDEITQLYQLVHESPGLEVGGLHLYDGQNHQQDIEDRRAAVTLVWQQAQQVAQRLKQDGLAVPRIVAGATGSFPVFAEFNDPALELSPGTVVLYDSGFQALYPDLDFTPAALVLSRVISKPGNNRLALDCGTKAIAADPPMGQRLQIPKIPSAVQVIHDEEHLVVETESASQFSPGDAVLIIPDHVCPTSALYQQMYVIENGDCVATWDVVARDRLLTI